MRNVQIRQYQKKILPGHSILAADIGGTNTVFGVFTGRAEQRLIITFHYESKRIANFPETVLEVLMFLRQTYEITISRACFAGAGRVSLNGSRLTLTNVPWDIDLQTIKQKTGLHSVMLINDFQAIAYALDVLPPKSILKVKPGRAQLQRTKAVLGAGTGLGKAILWHDLAQQKYIACPSEGGHGELPVVNKEEFLLATFIRSKTNRQVVEWEDILSGKGLQNIYRFFSRHNGQNMQKGNRYAEEIERNGFDPVLITKHYHKDHLSRKTVDLFLTIYARCARNFALDVLAEGGVYLAGGIAAGNSHLFRKQLFRKEFCRSAKQKALLQGIPVYVVKARNAGLFGAAAAVMGNKRAWMGNDVL